MLSCKQPKRQILFWQLHTIMHHSESILSNKLCYSCLVLLLSSASWSGSIRIAVMNLSYRVVHLFYKALHLYRKKIIKITILWLTSNVQPEKREVLLLNDETCRLALDFSLAGGRLNKGSLFLLMGSESGVYYSSNLSFIKYIVPSPSLQLDK